MQLAYKPSTNSVGLISSDDSPNTINFCHFYASSYKLADATMLSSRQRGWIHPQALVAIPGLYIAGGVNHQALLLIDATTLALRGEVLLSPCPLLDVASNGACIATMRDPKDTTPAMSDGLPGLI